MDAWPTPLLGTQLLDFERRGVVTRTFRRLDPGRQEAVVRAILDEAAERGPTALSIKRVASRAGVSVGSLYQYFGNRDNLIAFAVESCVRFMTEAFAASRPYLIEMPVEEAVKAYLSYGIEWGRTQQGFVQFFGRAAYQGDPALAEKVVRPIAAGMRELVREVLVRAAARGEIRPDVEIEAAARVINTLLIAVGDSQLLSYLNDYFQVTDESMPPQRILEALLALVMRGIGANV